MRFNYSDITHADTSQELVRVFLSNFGSYMGGFYAKKPWKNISDRLTF